MARIRITAYECEKDLLPPVCAECGKPTTTRLTRPARYFKDDWRFWTPFLAIFGLIFLPPLGIFCIVRFADRINLQLPMCEEHRDDYIWRDRAFLKWVLPIWTIAVLVLEIWTVIDVYRGPDLGGLLLLGVLIAAGMAVTADTFINLTAVRLQVQIKAVAVYLNNVHPDFVAALVEDRARSRIDDPSRRGKDDIKHDYDDELN